MRFPATDPKIADGQLSKQLKAWIVTRKAEAICDRTVAGGKYPHLCRFANHLYEALGNLLRIIAVDRPIEASGDYADWLYLKTTAWTKVSLLRNGMNFGLGFEPVDHGTSPLWMPSECAMARTRS